MANWQRAHAELATLFEGVPSHGCPYILGSETVAPYAGYRPAVREAPNGDTRPCPADNCYYGSARGPHGGGGTETWQCSVCHGTGRVPNLDAGKRWLHVADKYDPPAWARAWLDLAFAEACRVAARIGVPQAFMPRIEFGALRVLEYEAATHAWTTNPGSTNGIRICTHCHRFEDEVRDDTCPALAPSYGTVEHKDFDLFTLNLWRSTPEDHEQYIGRAGPPLVPSGPVPPVDVWTRGAPAYHIGEIGELVGLGPAAMHRVPARPYAQRALVYFAVSDHAARVWTCTDCGERGGCSHAMTVGEWLRERTARSRAYK